MLKRLVEDRVLFLFPKDREWQFAAAAILQEFVNGYDAKMRANTPTNAAVEFKLIYDVDISENDWRFFQEIGLKLDHKRTLMERRPDAVMDLREEKIDLFKGSSKHVTQAMGMISGVACLPLPHIYNRKPRAGEPCRWGRLGADIDGIEAESVDTMDITTAGDGVWTGFIIDRSWESYLAASMGLPVIELDDGLYNRYWMTKWTNRAWRLVDVKAGRVKEQIQQAQRGLEELLRCLALAQDKGKSTTETVASMFTAASVESS